MMLQKFFGATKSEIVFAFVIIFGLLIGLIIKITNSENQNKLTHQNIEKFYYQQDSISEAEKSTYIATDLQNNTAEELKRGDTIVKNDDFGNFPKKVLATEKIDLNIASRVQLMSLPGIGEKTADVIIEFRKSRPFSSPEDIMKIKGIGKKKFEKLKEYIEVK